DLGRLEGDRLVLMGRKKHMIIRKGVNLYPAVLESVVEGLTDHAGAPFVAHCAFIGRWDDAASDERLILVVEPAADTLDVDTFRVCLEAALGTAAVPDDIVVIDDMPTTGRLNKVDRQA